MLGFKDIKIDWKKREQDEKQRKAYRKLEEKKRILRKTRKAKKTSKKI